jgi:hypothetical protein
MDREIAQTSATLLPAGRLTGSVDRLVMQTLSSFRQFGRFGGRGRFHTPLARLLSWGVATSARASSDGLGPSVDFL